MGKKFKLTFEEQYYFDYYQMCANSIEKMMQDLIGKAQKDYDTKADS